MILPRGSKTVSIVLNMSSYLGSLSLDTELISESNLMMQDIVMLIGALSVLLMDWVSINRKTIYPCFAVSRCTCIAPSTWHGSILEKAGNNWPSSKGLREEDDRQRIEEAGGGNILRGEWCYGHKRKRRKILHLNVILDVRSMGSASSLLCSSLLGRRRNCTQSRETWVSRWQLNKSGKGLLFQSYSHLLHTSIVIC